MGFLCFENKPCKSIYSVKKGSLERSSDDVGFIPNLNINAKNLPCIVFWKSLCMCKIGPANACRKLCAQADSCMRMARVSFSLIFQKCRKLCAQADSCMCMVRVSFSLIFQKLIYFLIKNYIFHFNISQVNSTSDWTLNQPWVLEF